MKLSLLCSLLFFVTSTTAKISDNHDASGLRALTYESSGKKSGGKKGGEGGKGGKKGESRKGSHGKKGSPVTTGYGDDDDDDDDDGSYNPPSYSTPTGKKPTTPATKTPTKSPPTETSCPPPSPSRTASKEYYLRAEMGMYPDSPVEGADMVSGQVTLRFNPDGTFLTKLNVNGLLPDCVGCGAHVHEGTSCESADAPGGHYWDKELFGPTAEDDPWNYVFYNSTANGLSTSGFYINSGFNLEENTGHAFVLHVAGGDRMACGVLRKVSHTMTLTSDNIGQYPGYEGDLTPSGMVHVDFYEDSTLKFTYDASGLPANCDKCGIHIHTGTTCSDAALVGGHYWDITEQVPDPWVPEYGAFYTTNAHGKATGSFHLFSGYNYEENIDHAIVFHAQDGSRVGCGTLSE